jgi:aspartate/methionine/tyrosine aminotransferase
VSQVMRFNPWVLAAPAEDFRPVQDMLRQHADSISLAVAVPYKSPPSHILDAYHAALENGCIRYGPGRGLLQLREAIAKKLKDSNGVEADPETEIIVTHGAGHGFLISLLAFLSPGDEVLTADPSFPLNFGVPALLGAVPRCFRLCVKDNFKLDFDSLEQAVTPRTKLLIHHDPNNPTGTVCTAEDLERLARFVLDHDLVVLSDEVYEKFSFDGHHHRSLASFDGMKGRVVSLFSFSKEYALSGARLGYIVADRQTIDVISRIQQNDGSGANHAGQMAALAALTGPQGFFAEWLTEFDRSRHFAVEALHRIPGVTCSVPGGGLFVFADIGRLGTSDGIWRMLLRDARVGLAPGNWYGLHGEGYVRLCYGAVPFDVLERGLTRITEVLTRLSSS